MSDTVFYDLGKLEAVLAQRDTLARALKEIEDTPVSMVNDSESLRHSIKVIRSIARSALSASDQRGDGT